MSTHLIYVTNVDHQDYLDKCHKESEISHQSS
jgi:hypothetical protein